MTVPIVILTTTLLLGAALFGSSVPGVRQVRLKDRVDPYVGPSADSGSLFQATQGAGHRSTLALIAQPMVSDAVSLLDRALGGSSSVRTRLDRLGSGLTVERLRLEQLGWGSMGLLVAGLWGSARLAEGDVSGVVPGVVLMSLGFATGIFMRDRWLTREVERRMQQLEIEFPTVVELLALSVGAGEGLLAALERVSRVGRGAFVSELTRALNAIRSGTGTVDALRELSLRIDTPEMSRFVDALVIAIERGTPLVDVLHAQVLDAREASRRALIESGGRKEIAMMVPVVFLILPLSVVFALFPGFYGLSLGSA